MNDATMAAGETMGGSRALNIVRKLRAAGMEQPVAEAVGEVLSELPTREEVRREIEYALAKQFRQIVVMMIAMHAFSVTLMATLFLFSQR